MTHPARAVKSGGALVLRVEGALRDTSYLHVGAWWEAFVAAGHEVSCAEVHRAVGRSPEGLVEAVLGWGDERVVAGHAERWGRLRERSLTFPQAPELIRTAVERGLRVVLWGSGAAPDTAELRRRTGCEDAVATSVPQALAIAGVAPQRAVAVAATVADVRAARAARVASIGLRCGGISDRELRDAGAVAVHGDPAELLLSLDASPVAQLLLG